MKRFFSNKDVPDSMKALALELLVLPVLTEIFNNDRINNSDVIDAELLRYIVIEVFGSDNGKSANEELLIQLLRLGTLMIEFMADGLTGHRKDLIKFAWNHLKSDDNTTKNWAYVNVCRFISVYETPPKIILQVYVALLRAYKTDRALVCKALDILVPALPKRLPKDDFVKAIKWTKKVIFEDSNVNQIVHVWGVFSRNPSMFYVHRDQFVPQMVNSFK